MKRLLVVATVIVASVSYIAAPAAQTPKNANGNKIQCFDGSTDYPGVYYGICSLTTAGLATLNNHSPLDTPAGNDVTGVGNPYDQYSGVYLQNSNLDGKALKSVQQLAFDYTGTPTAGSPRLTLPIDKDGDGTLDVYASIGAFYCNDGAGHVDVIKDPTCEIFLNDNSAGPWANWADFVASNPTYIIAKGYLAFIIADDPGYWTVDNVQLGKGPARAAK